MDESVGSVLVRLSRSLGDIRSHVVGDPRIYDCERFMRPFQRTNRVMCGYVSHSQKNGFD